MKELGCASVWFAWSACTTNLNSVFGFHGCVFVCVSFYVRGYVLPLMYVYMWYRMWVFWGISRCVKGELKREVQGDVWVVGGSVRDLAVDEGVSREWYKCRD